MTASSTASSATETATVPASATPVVTTIITVVSDGPLLVFELLMKLVVGFSHGGEAKMHLAEEMVRKAAVVIQTAKVCATDVADLELLVSRGPRVVRQRL